MNRRRIVTMSVAAALLAILALTTSRHHDAAGGASATSAAARAPSQPVSTTNPTADLALPAEYAILKTRNAFAHGPHRAGGPDASLVFKGVAQTDARFTAFIEDTNAKNILRAAAGDAIGSGRVRSIDLDSVTYEVAGNSRRIEVGQNLNGEVVPPTPPPAPAAPPAAAPIDSQPPQGDGAGGPPQLPQPPREKEARR